MWNWVRVMIAKIVEVNGGKAQILVMDRRRIDRAVMLIRARVSRVV